MDFMNKARELVAHWREKWNKPIPTSDQPITPKVQARYSHISKPITEDVRLATQLGLHGMAAHLLMNQRGHTLYTPEGRVKKHADVLAEELGMNNKDRRRLRSSMRRRLRDMQAGAA